MKFYYFPVAPNPTRVRVFIREKGIKLDEVLVNLREGEQNSAEHLARNPRGALPVLELDDGTCISESIAICRYFEVLYPDNALMGSDPLEQAQIEMWQRRCEIYFMNLVGMGFQHTSGFFADRMTPVKEWGEICIGGAKKFMLMLEKHLENSEYIAGDKFSVADITALITVDFARVIQVRRDDDMKNLNRWYDQVSARPSAKA